MTLPSTTRTATATPAIPQPRSPHPDTTEAPTRQAQPAQPEQAQPVVPEPRGGEFPWPEPWRHSRAARPRSEFWNVETASWHSRGPYPDRSSSR
jgi:hypothetical protein